MLAAATFTLEIGLGGLLLLPFWVGGIGWLAIRVLGVHVGRLRAFVAALIGWLAGLIAAAVVLSQEKPSAGAVIALGVFFGVMITMPVAIILDLVTRGERPSRARRATLRHPVRALRRLLSPLGRFREVLAAARRENLLHVRFRSAAALDSPDFARRLRRALEDAGGMFVKFGQIASTRTDLLPRALTDELAALQGDVRPVPAGLCAG